MCHERGETTCRLCQNVDIFLATEQPFLPFYPLTSLSLGSTISSCRNFTRTKFFSLSKLFFWVAFLFWEMKMKSFTGISYLDFYQQNYLHKTTLKFKSPWKLLSNRTSDKAEFWNNGDQYLRFPDWDQPGRHSLTCIHPPAVGHASIQPEQDCNWTKLIHIHVIIFFMKSYSPFKTVFNGLQG